MVRGGQYRVAQKHITAPLVIRAAVNGGGTFGAFGFKVLKYHIGMPLRLEG